MMKKFIYLGLLSLLVFGCSKKGCKDPNAFNYNSKASVKSDPSSCEYLISDSDAAVLIEWGNINIPTLWEKVVGAEVDYYINHSIEINSTLTIGEGVVINFGPNGQLAVNLGKLIVEGTEENKVVFQSNSEEYWNGIYVYPNGEPNRKLKLVNVEIRKAAFLNTNVYSSIFVNSNCSIQLQNVTISEGKEFGLRYNTYTNSSLITNIVIKNCEYPLVTNSGAIVSRLNQFTLENNTNNVFLFSSTYFVVNSLFPNNYPIEFLAEVDVTFARLNAIGGTQFLLSGGRLIVEEELICSGTVGNPVVFKSKPGKTWKGLKANLEFNPTLTYTKIQNIEGDNPYPLEIAYSPDGSLTMGNCEVTGESINCGIYFEGTTTIPEDQYSITSTVFTGCDSEICP